MAEPRKAPRAPIVLDRAFDDPSLVRTLVARGGPYWTVQRYLANVSEMASLSDAGKVAPDRPMMIAPWFRGDWAFDGPKVEGVEPILGDAGFADAARRLFDAEVVVPQQVYVNLNPPMPQLDPGHVDIPTFRGVDRTNTPVWLLAIMLKSGLFEPWYVPIATAVAWFYEGSGGGFRYWPDGPDARPIDRPCRSNSAIVGDNDRMFHAVLAIGDSPTFVRGMTLESKLYVADDEAVIVDAGTTLARFPYDAIRISVSWKALTFPSDAERARFASGRDALTHADVERTILADLARRGVDATPPGDLLRDRAFVDRLNTVYGFGPTVFA